MREKINEKKVNMGTDALRFPSNRSLIFFFLKGSVRYFAAGAVFACLVALFDLIIPRLIQYTVDAVIGGDLSSIPVWAAGMIARLGGASFLRQNLWLSAAAVAAAALAGALCRYAFKMSNEIRVFVSEQLTSLLHVFILVFMSLYFMISIQPVLTAAAAVFIPIMIISSLIFYGLIGEEFETVDREEGHLSAIAQENLTGVRVVRTFGREKFERERFEKQNTFYTNHWIRLMRVLAAFWVSGNVIATVRNMTVAVFGAVLCVRGELTAGGMIAFLSYNALMSLPVRRIGRVIADMSKTGVSMERLRYIMNALPEDIRDDGRACCPPMNRDIVFSHVTFRYGKDLPEVLQDVSMRIRAGSTVGILGATGAGKSTLVQLLDRLWELAPEQGTISIGGVDIRDMDRGWLRRNIGMVLQEPYLFSRTLGDNILIAKQEGTLRVNPDENRDDTAEKQAEEAAAHDLEELRRAAYISCLDEAVDRFANGYDTFVGERGVTLSGGQKQRAAMAQMLVRRTPIMIFDDSLSAVDAETDARIRRELQKNTSDATVILIAHRITTLRYADEIFVLEKGRIAEHGSHDELLAQGGIYSRVYALQTDAAGRETPA